MILPPNPQQYDCIRVSKPQRFIDMGRHPRHPSGAAHPSGSILGEKNLLKYPKHNVNYPSMVDCYNHNSVMKISLYMLLKIF